jgi:(heptosyl)LPS beta-1,4-glucosyltransferase
MLNHKLSIVIITMNEEAVLQRCLNSCKLADQILVIDSGSTDATVDIARRNGADVIVQPWLGYPQQRNFGAKNARHDWILMLDADEVVTDELWRSILDTLESNPDPRDGFIVDRRGEIMGALLPDMRRNPKRRGDIRFYNRHHSAYDESRIVHEEVVPPGERHMLKGILLHYRESELQFIIAQNNKYTDMEAQMLSDAGERASLYKILYKPLVRFCWCYFACRAYKLGMRGFIYSSLKAFFDFLTYAKLWELHRSPARPAYDVRQYFQKPRVPEDDQVIGIPGRS